jgi:hypothetical protein
MSSRLQHRDSTHVGINVLGFLLQKRQVYPSKPKFKAQQGSSPELQLGSHRPEGIVHAIPITFKGALVTKDEYRANFLHISLNGSRSNSSLMGVPHTQSK